MEKEKGVQDLRSDISAGCVIPGTEIMLLELLKDESGQIKEIGLLVGKQEIVFTFIHRIAGPLAGTFANVQLWQPLARNYFIMAKARTFLHPKDNYDPGEGVRVSAKRLLYGLADEWIFGARKPAEIYRAIRKLVPKGKRRYASGGLVPEGTTFFVGERGPA